MNHMKKLFLALAVAVGLGLLGASDAAAQSTCTSFSVPTLVRTQGLTELTGDIILSGCTGAGIPAGGAALTVTVQPATAVVTNTLVGTAPIGITAVATGGAGTGAVTTAGNTVTVPLTVGVLTTLTISGIRVNVNASGVSFPNQIQALISSSPANMVAVTNNILNVAIPQNGITATFTNGGGIAQCSSATMTTVPANTTVTLGATPTANSTFSSHPGAPSLARVTVSEGYPGAWKRLGVAGPPALGEFPIATQGTRLILRITSLQSNIRISVPHGIVGTAAANFNNYNDVVGGDGDELNITRVTSPDASGVGSTPTVGAAGAPSVDLTTGDVLASGTTTIVYEVTDSSDSVQETVVIPIAFYTTGTPTVGTATISVALAPISTVGTASTTALIPRFVDAPLSGATVGVVGCVSNILFPYVVNRVGYDNGFAIANTTADVFGTAAQAGTCVYNFYGVSAPAGGTFTTSSIAAGTVDTRLLSILAPGFEGYVIAVCSFQLGHGFNFQVYNLGTSGAVAQGATALILPQPVGTITRVGAASTVGVGGFAEALGH